VWIPGGAAFGANVKIEVARAGVKVTVDAVAADGTVRHWGFTGNYDGKDNPVSGNSPYGPILFYAQAKGFVDFRARRQELAQVRAEPARPLPGGGVARRHSGRLCFETASPNPSPQSRP
jgi:hypothetical protein